jgi:hypothetical protein
MDLAGASDIQQLLIRAGVLAAVARLVVGSWVQQTRDRHLRWVRSFLSYINRRGITFRDAAPSDLAEFLAADYGVRRSRSAVDQARASISTVYRLVLERELSRTPLVSRMVKGIHRENPGRPQYHEYYDTDKLREYVRTLGPTHNLDLLALRDKAILLFRLASIRRGADLARVDISTRKNYPDRVEFRAQLTKEQALSKSKTVWSAPIVLLRRPDDLELCPVATLDAYLEKNVWLAPSRLYSVVSGHPIPILSSHPYSVECFVHGTVAFG